MNPIFLLQTVPEGRMFALDAQTFTQAGVNLIIVGILALILYLLLYKPVLNYLTARRASIDGNLESAEKNKAQAMALKSDYEQLIKKIDAEKYDIHDSARKQAAEQAKEKVAAARSKADGVRSAARAEIEKEKERAQVEMKQVAMDISNAIVGKFLSQEIDKAAQEQLFNEAKLELEGA